MKKPAFIALGDLHLDPYIWKRYRHICGDSYLGLSSLVDTALEWFVPIVLVGDIFDSVEPLPHTIRFFREQMDRCEEAGIRVYAIQGNHDKRPVPWYIAVHDWPQHIGDGLPVEIGGINCVGFDYMFRDRIAAELVELGRAPKHPQVLFLHQAVKQALRFEGSWNCDLEWCPEEIPLIILGDLHILWHHRVRENQNAYYTGASHARDVTQFGEKSCVMVHEDLSVSRVPIAYRNMQRFRLTAPHQVEELKLWTETVASQEHRLVPLAWVTHTPSVGDLVQGIVSIHDPKIIFVIDGIADAAEIELELEVERADVNAAISAETLLAKIIDPDKEGTAYRFVLNLLERRQNVFDTIRETRDEFIANQ